MGDEGQNSIPVESMSITDLLRLLMKECQLRVEGEHFVPKGARSKGGGSSPTT